MSSAFNMGPGLSDEAGQDRVLAEQLAVLDPASEDPGYWLRFRTSVMSEAARALAQRRLIADVTIADVLQSWGRAVVPAALAAAMAGLMLLRSASVDGGVIEPMQLEPVPVADLEAPAALPELSVGFAALGPEAF